MDNFLKKIESYGLYAQGVDVGKEKKSLEENFFKLNTSGLLNDVSDCLWDLVDYHFTIRILDSEMFKKSFDLPEEYLGLPKEFYDCVCVQYFGDGRLEFSTYENVKEIMFYPISDGRSELERKCGESDRSYQVKYAFDPIKARVYLSNKVSDLIKNFVSDSRMKKKKQFFLEEMCSELEKDIKEFKEKLLVKI